VLLCKEYRKKIENAMKKYKEKLVKEINSENDNSANYDYILLLFSIIVVITVSCAITRYYAD
jgi:hypothetical protein